MSTYYYQYGRWSNDAEKNFWKNNNTINDMSNSSVDIESDVVEEKQTKQTKKNHISLKYVMLKLFTIADCHPDYCFVCVCVNSETDWIKCLDSMINIWIWWISTKQLATGYHYMQYDVIFGTIVEWPLHLNTSEFLNRFDHFCCCIKFGSFIYKALVNAYNQQARVHV